MNLHAGISQLLFVGDRLHEGRKSCARSQKIGPGNDAVEFRNENAISSAVVSDENVPVSEVFLCRVGYVIEFEARHFRRGTVNTHDDETPGLFLSPERPSCVHYLTLGKEKLAKRAPENYALGICSDTEQFARLSAYRARDCLSNISNINKFQFVAATPSNECATITDALAPVPAVIVASNSRRP